jgi:hypothetical protein
MLCTETWLREEKQLLRHLLLEQLVAHGVEGDGQPAAKEEDEVDGQLVAVVDGEGEVVPGRRQAVVIVLNIRQAVVIVLNIRQAVVIVLNIR